MAPSIIPITINAFFTFSPKPMKARCRKDLLFVIVFELRGIDLVLWAFVDLEI